jgi:hypothetical protein|tara:strand:+ start:9042 stop:9146 length:105 start_codon:yes stop_codon:yes gene_type:complete
VDEELRALDVVYDEEEGQTELFCCRDEVEKDVID